VDVAEAQLHDGSVRGVAVDAQSGIKSSHSGQNRRPGFGPFPSDGSISTTQAATRSLNNSQRATTAPPSAYKPQKLVFTV
jgi:hypothetical protein